MPKTPIEDTGFKSFWEFFPFYVSQHSLPVTKVMHIIGTLGALVLNQYLMWYDWKWNGWEVALKAIGKGLLFGYGMAWVSHFFLEKNRPATFKYPSYSFAGDWVISGLSAS